MCFPNWGDGVKDAGNAVMKYGRIGTVSSILQSVEYNKLKIELKWSLDLNNRRRGKYKGK